jgi:hypothetical protein
LFTGEHGHSQSAEVCPLVAQDGFRKVNEFVIFLIWAQRRSREVVIPRETPRTRGIQYAAASRLHIRAYGIPDHPLSRVMTGVGGLARRANRL